MRHGQGQTDGERSAVSAAVCFQGSRGSWRRQEKRPANALVLSPTLDRQLSLRENLDLPIQSRRDYSSPPLKPRTEALSCLGCFHFNSHKAVILRACDFFGKTISFGLSHPHQNMNCHPDRSEAKWRACPERSRMGTCCFLHQRPT